MPLALALAAASVLQLVGTAAAVDCTSKLVAVSTSPDTSCPTDAPKHWYPVGGDASDCHGWAAKDTNGREHLNSASNFKCNGDGSFSLTQYAGNLDCSGSGTDKTFHLAECEQDRPPVLWSQAADLTCCSAPGSSACKVGTPSVSREGSAIYLNGQVCSSSSNSSTGSSLNETGTIGVQQGGSSGSGGRSTSGRGSMSGGMSGPSSAASSQTTVYALSVALACMVILALVLYILLRRSRHANRNASISQTAAAI